MKKLLGIALLASTLFSCQKEQAPAVDAAISDDVLAAIEKAGFSKEGVIREEGGYIVEGDIFIDDAHLRAQPQWGTLTIAQTEQYHTTNTVKEGTGRVITVGLSNKMPAAYAGYLQTALGRYNAEGLKLTFQYVTSGTADITLFPANGSYLASAGFPTSAGDPYNRVNVNTRSLANYNFSSNAIVSVLAHEIGHCIGYRHTDYADRSFSCGGSTANEGASTVGAIYIPGTAVGPNDDATSWMLACIGQNTNRPFNANDKTALAYLYK